MPPFHFLQEEGYISVFSPCPPPPALGFLDCCLVSSACVCVLVNSLWEELFVCIDNSS